MHPSTRSFASFRLRRHHIIGRAPASSFAADLNIPESGGRACPLHYRYGPRALSEEANDLDLGEARALYVVGGLYGNIGALRAVETRAASEAEAPAIVFNGDFHFFNSDPHDWEEVNRTVMRHHAITGNVEREISGLSDGSCGCAYPLYVSEDVVDRSNEIVSRLRQVAQRGDPSLIHWLSQLPMFMTVRVGPMRLGIVHGDVHALSGWALSVEALEPLDQALRSSLGCDNDPYFVPSSEEDVQSWLSSTRCDALASTHTCLPFAQKFPGSAGYTAGEDGAIFNNGAAGMPNFDDSADRFGVMTRVAVSTDAPEDSLYGVQLGRVRMDAIPIRYDQSAWVDHFTRLWPSGSAAHTSYFPRITQGPSFTIRQAARNTGLSAHPYYAQQEK